MNVGRKLMLIVIASVALVSIPSAGVIYYFTKQNILVTEAATLASETGTPVASNVRNLVQAEASLSALSRMLGKVLSAPPQEGEGVAFDRLYSMIQIMHGVASVKSLTDIWKQACFCHRMPHLMPGRKDCICAANASWISLALLLTRLLAIYGCLPQIKPKSYTITGCRTSP